MEPKKHNISSVTSSAESDDQNQPEKPNEGGGGRSYECSFCKRGFTNAQALGGHMNIHRKEKAKAKPNKQKKNIPLIQSFKSNENIKNSSCYPQTSSTDCINYQVYLPSSNHGIQTGINYQYDYFPVWRSDNLKDYNMMDENLSLRIGLRPPVEDEEEVDLELRLGQYP